MTFTKHMISLQRDGMVCFEKQGLGTREDNTKCCLFIDKQTKGRKMVIGKLKINAME